MTDHTTAAHAAMQESERVTAADEYFKARTWIMDTNDNRRIFEAGFDRAYALLSKLRAPVASAEVMDALNWVDDFIARCNRDDRGSCESVNVLRRALASAPVAMIDTAKLAQLLDSVNGDCYLGKEKEEDLVQSLRSQLRARVAEPEWIDDPHDIEQGMMRNPKYVAPGHKPVDTSSGHSAPVADERISLLGAANLAFNALHECKPAKGAEKQYSDAIQALQSALHDIAYTVNRTATPQQFADHLQREARAALASASVADESPMAKVAEALREKARQEQQAYQDRRAQATEWGPMPTGTQADDPSELGALADGLESIVGNENAALAAAYIRREAKRLASAVGDVTAKPVAWVAGDDASRYLEWDKERSAWEMPIGTPVFYAAPQASEADAMRQAIKACGEKVIKALAAIAKADGPDTRKADDPELIYRSPVMDEVVRIRQAYDELESALKTPADKDGGDCAKGAGDHMSQDLDRDIPGSFKAFSNWVMNQPNDQIYVHSAQEGFLAGVEWCRQQHAALSPTPSVVKQSLTATQTGEKGESDA